MRVCDLILRNYSPPPLYILYFQVPYECEVLEFYRTATKQDADVTKTGNNVRIKKPVAYCSAEDLIHHVREESTIMDRWGDGKVRIFRSNII